MSATSTRPRITEVRIPPITDYAVDGISTSQTAIDGHAPVLATCNSSVMANASNRRSALDAIVAACSTASVTAGFAELELQPLADNLVRVVALNPAGQALVSEIRVDKDHASVATEVVGVRDGSCVRILDAFDAALEAEGVRSAAPRRKSTGGVAELAGAREFVRKLGRRLQPAKLDGAAPVANAGSRGSRRTNARNHQHS